MIVRKIETCPKCGTRNPWRKYCTKTIKGEKREYVRCRHCKTREVIIYR